MRKLLGLVFRPLSLVTPLMIVTILMLVIISMLVAMSSLAWARSPAIIIEGAEGKSAKILRTLIEENLTTATNLSELQNVMGLIYNTGQYNDVEVYFDEKGDQTEVIFKVFPLRIVRSIQFVGNISFSTLSLASEMGMNEGDGYAADRVKAGVENVKRYYNLNGYLNASVTGEFQRIEGSSDLILKINITEGEPCTIEDIVFKSVNAPLNRDLQKHFRDNKKNIFTQSLLTGLQNDVNDYLFKEKYYSATALAPEAVYNPLKTRVTLNYVINDPYEFVLNYEGNRYFDPSQIEKRLDLGPTNRLSNSPIEDLMERIIRIYKKSGFPNVNVKYHESLFTQDYERRVAFQIAEGARVKIKDIIFEGTYSRPMKYYKTFLMDHSSDLISSDVYNSDDIETGIKNLISDLQNQGFIGAKVTGSRTDFDQKRESAVIKITLDEGPQTFISKIIFKGIHSISQGELENAMGLSAKGPLNLGVLELASSRITDLYQSRGYLDAQVVNQGKNIISYSADNTKATLTFDINEGPQITVSSIVIEGNTFTKEFVIRRELQFHPGDVLTPEKLSYTQQRLQRLSLFSSIEIHTLEEDPNLGNRTVLVHVQERNPGVLKAGGGINNDLFMTLKAFVGAAYHNLWGTGRGINFRAEVDDKVYYNNFIENVLNAGYSEPFIFNSDNTGRVNFTESTKIYSISGPYVYAVDTLQGDTILERDLTPRLKLIYDVYGLAQEHTYEITGTPGAPNANTINIATTGPTLNYDRRNDQFNPTKGDFTTVTFEFSNPTLGSTGTVFYYRTEGGYTRYTQIGRMVWANEFKGGYAKNLSNDPSSAIPSIKGFFLGGPATIRGFSPQEAFPALTEYPLNSQPPYVNFYSIPVDTYYVLVKTELRFPIYGNFGGVVFYDGGKVGMPGYTPTFAWRDSVGVGLQYQTPVGPVSLEWAEKLEVDNNRGSYVGPESPGQLIFSIGVF